MGFVLGAALIIGGAGLVTGIVSSATAASEGKKNRAMAEKQANAAAAQQAEMQAKLDAQKEIYKQMEFKNPYKDIENVFAENVFEDLTINQQQAKFQAQQGRQQRASILEKLKSVAGGSGVASLAQAMANQGALQAQAISADIGAQESRLQYQRAQGEVQVQQGEAAAQMARLGGEASLQQAEMDRQATLLGMAQSGAAGANAALQQAYSNQMAAATAASQMKVDAWSSMSSSMLGAASTVGAAKIQQTPGDSDRRLKKNINKIGESPSGLNIYSFEYIDSKYGEGLFQAVMSDEIPQEAVSSINGYDKVDYSMLDVEFKQI